MENENFITSVDILDEARDNFLTYAAEVLLDRAVPAIEDGLLSVQRKILWTMEDYFKMTSKGKMKKCNGVVGGALATSYYHGDASCYGALCKLAQPYLMRYPLIDGKGNLGSQESNGMEAASRYTECRPSPYADLLFKDFKKDIVPLKATYNNEFMEPVVLPGLFPNAICNGQQAIAVSMAHCTPSNNLTEACNAIIRYLRQGSLTLDELLEEMPGPDFPNGGTVINKSDVRKAYETGKSTISLKVRGDYEIEDNKIIFTSIPYRTYRDKIKEQIAKNIDTIEKYISDFDDFSHLGQNRLIFTVKPDVPIQTALDVIFSKTDLQTSVSYNMNFVVNGTPKLCSMFDLIKFYAEHQADMLIKASERDKEKAEARVHILEGILKAIDVIDKVVELIENANSRVEANAELRSFLEIDEKQAEAILSMQLARLTRLDKQELLDEKQKLEKKIDYWTAIINDKETRDKVLIETIAKMRDAYGDARRTKLLDIEINKPRKEPPVVIPKDVVVVITNTGIVKRIPRESFKTQRRNTVGVKTKGNITIFSARSNTIDYLMIFSSKGKMYRIYVDSLPEGTNATGGAKLSSIVNFEENEIPIAYTTLGRDTNHQFIFFATKHGIVKRVPLELYDNMKKTGIITIALKPGDEVAGAAFINQEPVIIVSRSGRAIFFETKKMPISSRTAQGVKGMAIAEDDNVVAVMPIGDSASSLAIVSESNHAKLIELSEFNIQNRGGKGVIVCKDFVAGAAIISNKDETILVNGDQSSIVVSAADLPTLPRYATGNLVLKDNNKIVSVSMI